MKKYKCTICGYVYDEEKGIPEKGIAPGTKWEDLPENWICPWCGAPKFAFKEEKQSTEELEKDIDEADNLDENNNKNEEDNLREISFGELSAICSNLAKGCEKQYLERESQLFKELSDYYKAKSDIIDSEEKSFEELVTKIERELTRDFGKIKKEATEIGDRGTLRALTWGEKVTRILDSLIKRYNKDGKEFIEKTNVYVCDICGFIYIGDTPPEICPICKVPNLKILKVERGQN